MRDIPWEARAQANSLPKNPPPTMATCFASLTADVKLWKSAICKEKKEEKRKSQICQKRKHPHYPQTHQTWELKINLTFLKRVNLSFTPSASKAPSPRGVPPESTIEK